MSRLLSTSAVALIVAASPVFAELTPAQVWDSIAEAQKKFGYEVTEGGREEAGDTLTLTDVKLHISSEVPLSADPATEVDEAAAAADAAADAAQAAADAAAGAAEPEASADAPLDDAAAAANAAADAAQAASDAAAAAGTPEAAADAPLDDAADAANAAADAADAASDAATAAAEPAAPAEEAAASEDAAEMGDATVDIIIPKIVLQQTGDGNVRTVYEGDITGNAVTPITADTQTDVKISIAMPGNEMISSGTPEEMSHTFTYPTLDAAFDITDPEGQTMPLKVSLADTKGSYQTNSADGGQETTYEMSSNTLNLTGDLNIVDPEAGNSTGKLTATLNGLSSTGTMKVPEGEFDLTNQMNDALKAGMAINGTITFGAYTGGVEMSGAQTMNASAEGEGGDLTIAIAPEGLNYKATSKAAKASITSDQAPFPINYAITGGSGNILLPVLASDEAVPLNFSYQITGLTLGDEIWGMFDPTAQLPRDPADLNFDISSMVKVTRDLLDPTMSARMMAASTPAEGATELTDEQLAELQTLQDQAMPYEPQTITINKVALNAVGAQAEVTGELSVPEGGSIEQPVGTLNGTFKGVNGLIDRLAALGFVPQEQVAGMRMMMSAFAKPVEGQEDTLESKIEFREGGSIFANGQQVK